MCLVGIQEAPCGLYYYRRPMRRWADAVNIRTHVYLPKEAAHTHTHTHTHTKAQTYLYLQYVLQLVQMHILLLKQLFLYQYITELYHFRFRIRNYKIQQWEKPWENPKSETVYLEKRESCNSFNV